MRLERLMLLVLLQCALASCAWLFCEHRQAVMQCQHYAPLVAAHTGSTGSHLAACGTMPAQVSSERQ
jgi:hypothetical protein